MADVIYSVVSDFTSLAVATPNFDILGNEITSSAIASAVYQGALLEDDAVTLRFDVAPSAGDETILDGIVAAHTGESPAEDNEVNHQDVVVDGAPSPSNNGSQGYTLGSTWVDTTTNTSYTLVDDSPGNAIWNPDETQGHVAKHKRGGTDELDGDQLAVDFVPANYTRSTSPPEADDVRDLTAHLKGIDDAMGAVPSDHGALGGLGDDDHPQYTKADGTRPFTGPQSMGGNKLTNLGTPTAPADAATKEYVDQNTDWQDSVLDRDLATPPGSPSTGDRYIVAASGTGAWAGQDNNIAEWNGSIWVFTTPNAGATTYVEDENEFYTFDGASWQIRPGGVASHGDLPGLGDDDHPQYTKADGTRPFTGDQSFGGNAATNVASVNGVVVETHATRHENGGADEINVAGLNGELADPQPPKTHASTHARGGADAIDGDILDVTFVPTNYTRDTSPGQVTDNEHLTAHLKGIDNHVGSTSNPHAVTKAQVGLGNITDDAQLKRAGADFTTFPAKDPIVAADTLLIEDSENSDAKAKITVQEILDLIPVVPNKFFDAYDTTGGTAVAGTWVDVPLDAERIKDDIYTHANPSPEVTVSEADKYIITARVTTAMTSGSRSQSQLRIMLDTGSGFNEVPGTLARMYNRTTAQGEATGTVVIATTLSAGDKLKVQVQRVSGSAALNLLADGSSLTVLRVGTGLATGSSDAASIQGIPVSSATPADGQILVYNNSSGQWEPAAAPITPVFGSEYRYNENLAQDTTTGSAFVTRATLSATVPAGTYHIQWSSIIGSLDDEGDYGARVQVNAVTVASITSEAPLNWTPSHESTFAGFLSQALNGAITINLEYHRPAGLSGTALMRDARLTMWRVS